MKALIPGVTHPIILGIYLTRPVSEPMYPLLYMVVGSKADLVDGLIERKN